jgi:hypothetical protein
MSLYRTHNSDCELDVKKRLASLTAVLPVENEVRCRSGDEAQ